MIKILLVCIAGMSTSFLVEKMKGAAKSKGLDAEINAVAEASAKDYVGKIDILLLGPQVKYLESSMKSMFTDIPVSVINFVDYGSMNGEKVLNTALELLGE